MTATKVERLVSDRISADTGAESRTQWALTPATMAARYGVDVRTIRTWLRSGVLASSRIGPHWRITWETVLCLEGWPLSIHGDARKRAMAIAPLNVAEIAKRWACCQETVRRRLREGALPLLRIGHSIYVRADYLNQYEQKMSSSRRICEN